MKKPANNGIFLCMIPGITTFGILILLFIIYGYAPFGNKTLATMDAHIQYLDFFMYLKNVLNGNDRITYTFGQTLGGCNIAVFSYYLSSPLNLLIVFFSKENLHVFFHLLILCKLSLSAVTFHIFLKGRFGAELQEAFQLLLSVCYALCQYNIAQSSNVMWLDGVYLLPLLLLGVYHIVKGSRSRIFILAGSMSVLFNWYMGAVNCLFSAVWFCVECGYRYFVGEEQTDAAAKKIRSFLVVAMRYVGSSVMIVLLSMVLLLPTMASLQSGRGKMDWEELTFGITGEIPGMLQSYVIGGTSSFGSVSLFCGSMAVIACIGCFLTKYVKRKEKVLAAGILLTVIALFCWKPCFFLFSLLKRADSYYYRYSYLGIFLLLFIAALFFRSCFGKELSYTAIKSAGLFCFGLIFLHYVKPVQDTRRVYLTALCAVLTASVIALYGLYYKKAKCLMSLAVAAAVCGEMAMHATILMEIFHVEDVADYRAYVEQEQRQINEIHKLDGGTYRISQTATKNMKDNHLTANYNEALAFGYWSLSGYTSDPDDRQRSFLDHLGYPMNGANMCITNTSILAADSLLGVKYLLSPYRINGTEEIKELQMKNGKYVYENPFCLPFAFRYKKAVSMEGEALNPFEYQNDLYARLLGKDNLRLYVPVSYQTDYRSESEVIYELDIPEGNYAVYGNLPWEYYMEAVLNVNDVYETGYSMWLSPAVFYIPVSDRRMPTKIQLTTAGQLCVKEEQFYMLDLDKMKAVTQELSQKVAEEIRVANGDVRIMVENAENEEYLYTSVPYDSGWKIRVNGKETEAELIDGCLITIPLQSGKNRIEMSYEIPYLKTGMCMTLFGIGLLLVFDYMKNRSVSE